jgi:hypothetical protein
VTFVPKFFEPTRNAGPPSIGMPRPLSFVFTEIRLLLTRLLSRIILTKFSVNVALIICLWVKVYRWHSSPKIFEPTRNDGPQSIRMPRPLSFVLTAIGLLITRPLSRVIPTTLKFFNNMRYWYRSFFRPRYVTYLMAHFETSVPRIYVMVPNLAQKRDLCLWCSMTYFWQVLCLKDRSFG